jgi:hypothetical protein
MTASDGDLVERMAEKHAVSPAAVEVVLAALRSGGGGMAQFSHADFGGMSQWSPGMSMVGEMFNTQLKAKLDGLCSDLADHLSSAGVPDKGRDAGDEVSYRSATRSSDCGRKDLRDRARSARRTISGTRSFPKPVGW